MLPICQPCLSCDITVPSSTESCVMVLDRGLMEMYIYWCETVNVVKGEEVHTLCRVYC